MRSRVQVASVVAAFWLAAFMVGCGPPLMMAETGADSDARRDVAIDATLVDSRLDAPADGTADAPEGCRATEMMCTGVCVDVSTDSANCGSCGHPCTENEACRAGVCEDTCPAPMMRCATAGIDGGSAVNFCIDPRVDSNNCGGCGTVCPAGRDCVDSVCACGGGQMLCAGVCIDTMTNDANCGACGAGCVGTQNCVAGVCTCPGGLTLCDGGCVNTESDNNHCGSCPVVCGPGTSCNGGMCDAVCAPEPGTIFCSGACVNPSNSNMHCGRCDNVCPAGTGCATSTCRPLNDMRANATPLALGTGETTVTGNTTNATQDGPTPCGCTGGGNIWYRFSLGVREVFYADTAGSAYDTSIFVTDTAGTAITGLCSDDGGCATGGFTNGLQSRMAAIIGPGTFYLAVGGCGQGAFTLHLQHIRTNIGSFFYPSPISGTSGVSTSIGGVSASTSGCGGNASGEDVRWFMTCGATQQFFSMCMSDGGTFSRTVAGRTFDPAMYIYSGISGSQTVCNDDGGSMGGTNCTGTGGDTAGYGSRLNNVVVGRGIHAHFVDERVGGPGMSYTMRYTIR